MLPGGCLSYLASVRLRHPGVAARPPSLGLRWRAHLIPGIWMLKFRPIGLLVRRGGQRSQQFLLFIFGELADGDGDLSPFQGTILAIYF
jgi:hypothetical protein